MKLIKRMIVILSATIGFHGNATTEPLLLSYQPDHSLESPMTSLVNQYTFSGVSSGAFMAIQMGVIYSNETLGVGSVAGGFYYCAQNFMQEKITQAKALGLNDLALFEIQFDYGSYLGNDWISPYKIGPNNPTYQAVGVCMGNPTEATLPQLTLEKNFKEGLIADPVNIKTQKIFLYQGKLDHVVKFPMLEKTEEFYKNLGVVIPNLVISENDHGAHNFPTDHKNENACDSESIPFISSCTLNIAGDILSHLTDNKQLVRSNSKNLYSVNQNLTLPTHSLKPNSIASYGYLAASDKCLENPELCHLHIALHGCEMSDSFDAQFDKVYSRQAAQGYLRMRSESESLPFSQLQYIEQKKNNMGLLKFAVSSGYMEYIEQNDLMILFPQTWITTENYPYNPKGCWDWFGWTGANYATNKGAESSWLINWIHEIKGNPKSFLIKKVSTTDYENSLKNN